MRKPLVTAWSEQDLERFRLMVLSGASAARCSAAFNRPVTSIMSQARKLGLPIAGKRKFNAAQKAKIAAAEDRLGPGAWRFDGTRV